MENTLASTRQVYKFDSMQLSTYDLRCLLTDLKPKQYEVLWRAGLDSIHEEDDWSPLSIIFETAVGLDILQIVNVLSYLLILLLQNALWIMEAQVIYLL